MDKYEAVLQGILEELGRTHECLREILNLLRHQLIEEIEKEAEG